MTDQPENDWTGINTDDLHAIHAALTDWIGRTTDRLRDEIAAELDYRNQDDDE